MSLARKVADLMSALTYNDIRGMRPADRRQFADMCRNLARIADPEVRLTNTVTRSRPSGVLYELNQYRREA